MMMMMMMMGRYRKSIHEWPMIFLWPLPRDKLLAFLHYTRITALHNACVEHISFFVTIPASPLIRMFRNFSWLIMAISVHEIKASYRAIQSR